MTENYQRYLGEGQLFNKMEKNVWSSIQNVAIRIFLMLQASKEKDLYFFLLLFPQNVFFVSIYCINVYYDA